MSVSRRWTVADLEQLETKETERYEIIDGELIVTTAPSWRHQRVGSRIWGALDIWSEVSGLGLPHEGSGVVFDAENAVIPDLVWISFEKMRRSTDRAGHFLVAPELVVEMLSPGSENARRDRRTKLALYSREGVYEYWIIDVEQRTIEVYRRDAQRLNLYETYGADGVLETPILPGFHLEIARIWPPTL
jgi:Uma2 family endonuclease